jgi:selenocysteine lyase/cysteine desulfurase
MTDTLVSFREIRETVVGINQKVPLLDGSMRTYINFDNAASTPALGAVSEKVNAFLEWYSSVHRGTGFKSQISTRSFDQAREIVSDFVGANFNEHVVIFGKNTTEAINKLAFRLPLKPDDVVLVSMMEHHSNDLPWRARAQVEHIKVDRLGQLDVADFEERLARLAGRVKLVAISGASNVTGFLADVHALAVKAHEAGAQILVDCAQLAPHRRVDMLPLADPAHFDYVSISAHKMYAPFGTGALIGRRDTFEQGEPEYRGGGTIEIVTPETVDWAAPPDKDEAGSPNVVGAVALGVAIKQMQAVGMEAIAAHEAELTSYALEKLVKIPNLEIYGNTDPAHARAGKRLGVIPFNITGMSHFKVAAILSAEYAIGVRNGCFCAHPYLLHLMGIADEKAARVRHDILANDRSEMPGLVRVSFGIYNTTEEIDVLVEALTNIAAGNYKGEYIQDTVSGEYRIMGWNFDPNEYFTL